MKILLMILSLMTNLISATAFAMPQETAFQYDRGVMKTILNNDQVLERLEYKGKIESISATDINNVFMINTTECKLAVKFIRTCTYPRGELPRCNNSSFVLLEQSLGNCER